MSRIGTEKRLICTQPFSWCEIHPDGSVFLCCPAWLKTPVGNLLQEPLERVWNSGKARAIRQSVLDGSFSCCNRKRCPRLPDATPPVMPRDRVVDGEIRRAIEAGQTMLPYGPKILNLCYDRSCNLACASCRNDFFIAGGEAEVRVNSLAQKIGAEAGRSAESLILSGTGDPFGSPGFRRMLREFRPADYPRLKNIHLHSNGQLWDPALWESMAPIHPYVHSAEISVDAATAETYAHNRRGGDFNRLLANLAFIRTLPVEMKLSFVVQANNYREMPAFVDLARQYGCRVYFSQLVNWGTFSKHEFRRRAVHLADHPEHNALIDTLGRLAPEPDVDLGNLLPLIRRKDGPLP